MRRTCGAGHWGGVGWGGVGGCRMQPADSLTARSKQGRVQCTAHRVQLASIARAAATREMGGPPTELTEKRVQPQGGGAHHDAREVDGSDSVEQQEQRGVGEGAEAQQQARGRQQRGDVQVGEVGGPGGGLVLCGGSGGECGGGEGSRQPSEGVPKVARRLSGQRPAGATTQTANKHRLPHTPSHPPAPCTRWWGCISNAQAARRPAAHG